MKDPYKNNGIINIKNVQKYSKILKGLSYYALSTNHIEYHQQLLEEMFIQSMCSELISINFLGSFSKGYHALTFCDHFSKHMELFLILRDLHSNLWLSLFISINFGCLDALMSDLGLSLHYKYLIISPRS